MPDQARAKHRLEDLEIAGDNVRAALGVYSAAVEQAFDNAHPDEVRNLVLHSLIRIREDMRKMEQEVFRAAAPHRPEVPASS